LSNTVELPDIDEINEMDRKRAEAIQKLQVSDGHVLCQKCGTAVPLLNNPDRRPTSKRVASLKWQIQWLKTHYYPDKKSQKDSIAAMEKELAEILQGNEEYDKLRNIPLYSAKITDWRFVCSKCYEKAYSRRRRN
jgi:hypothetical protein